MLTMSTLKLMKHVSRNKHASPLLIWCDYVTQRKLFNIQIIFLSTIFTAWFCSRKSRHRISTRHEKMLTSERFYNLNRGDSCIEMMLKMLGLHEAAERRQLWLSAVKADTLRLLWKSQKRAATTRVWNVSERRLETLNWAGGLLVVCQVCVIKVRLIGRGMHIWFICVGSKPEREREREACHQTLHRYSWSPEDEASWLFI